MKTKPKPANGSTHKANAALPKPAPPNRKNGRTARKAPAESAVAAVPPPVVQPGPSPDELREAADRAAAARDALRAVRAEHDELAREVADAGHRLAELREHAHRVVELDVL